MRIESLEESKRADSLQIDAENWLKQREKYGHLFYRVSGRLESIAKRAKTVGKSWLCGLGASSGAFKAVASTA